MEIVRPDPAMHADFVEVMDEFAAAGEYPHGSGVLADDQSAAHARGPVWRVSALRDPLTFAEFCHEVRRRSDRAYAVSLGLVPDDKLWLVEGGALVGFLSVRHELNDFLLQRGGHIGYGVRPAARRRGLATAACAHGLELLRARGVDRALITCNEDNRASAATIERNGGVLEGVSLGMRRYWVDLSRG